MTVRPPQIASQSSTNFSSSSKRDTSLKLTNSTNSNDLEVEQTSDKIYLDQKLYILKLLAAFGVTNFKPIFSPALNHCLLTHVPGEMRRAGHDL